jgi:glycosyltransferase involved in cell wall biosynthesis
VIATEMTLKDTAPSAARRLRDAVIHPLAAAAMRRCDRVVVTSRFIKEQWCARGGDGNFEVIYPPFSVEKYEQASKVTRQPAAGPRIGFVGRLSEEKSIGTLIAAFAEVHRHEPAARLTIVGTGPQEASLKTLAARLGVAPLVTFTGYLPNSFEALRDMDVFVLPSRSEGCPIVVLEAMAMGLPVVATDVGGNPELVTGGRSGILTAPGSVEEMASAILFLIRHREAAAAMGRAGHERAFGEMHPARFTERLQELYSGLCAGAPAVS